MMNMKDKDENDFLMTIEQARLDRETLSRQRHEVGLIIKSLSARQVEFQESLNRQRSQRNIVAFSAIHREILTVDEKQTLLTDDQPIKINLEESSVWHKREKTAQERNRLANVRIDILIKREKAADVRSEVADQRDLEAEARVLVQNALNTALNERERQLKLAELSQQHRENFLRRCEQRYTKTE